MTNDEDAYIINGGSSLKVMMIGPFLANGNSILADAPCVRYYEGMICRRKWVSEKNSADCLAMHNQYKLEVQRDYFTECPTNFTLYRIRQKEQ